MLLQEFNARLSHGYFNSIKNQRNAIQWHFEKFDVVKRDVKLFDRLRKDGTPSKRSQQMFFVNESGFYAFEQSQNMRQLRFVVVAKNATTSFPSITQQKKHGANHCAMPQ